MTSIKIHAIETIRDKWQTLFAANIIIYYYRICYDKIGRKTRSRITEWRSLNNIYGIKDEKYSYFDHICY